MGFFENFAFHVLVAGGVLATYPDLDELVIIRPNRINNFAKDNKRVRAALRDARDETRDARSHPRGAVRVNIVGKSIVDFPTPYMPCSVRHATGGSPSKSIASDYQRM